jgi:hypothetical protein
MAPAPNERGEQEVFDELEAVCASSGYVHVLAFLSFRDNMILRRSHDQQGHGSVLRATYDRCGHSGSTVLIAPMHGTARAMREHPDSLDKRDLMFAAKATSLRPPTKPNLLARIALNERALALDPNYVWALREDALSLAYLVLTGFSSDRDADLARATKAADRALELTPNDNGLLRTKAVVLRAHGNLDQAAALVRKVIERAPLSGWAHRDLGQILLLQGHYKEALDNFVSAKQLISVTGPDPSGRSTGLSPWDCWRTIDSPRPLNRRGWR